jgi:endo-1,3(4)-beta-glucanase
MWAKGKGASHSWGMAISHVDASQRVYGPPSDTTGSGAASYFINPSGIQSLCVSAKELGSSSTLTTDQLSDTYARVSLSPSAQGKPAIQVPLYQGAAFFTSVFNGARPMIQSGVLYKTVTRATKQIRNNVTKYKFVLEDGHTWLAYAYHVKGDPLDLQVLNNSTAQAKGPFVGIIQIAKDPGGGEALYDQYCGVYATGFKVSGSLSGSQGTYTFTWSKAGSTGTKLLLFALPHHVETFNSVTKSAMTSLKLQTTTKGIGTAVAADTWTMTEPNLPTSIGFTPWHPAKGSISALSANAKAYVSTAAQQEIVQNIQQQTNQSSMYFSGKVWAPK